MTQVAILIFSCTSIFLFSTKRYFRWGFVWGLASQPWWIYAAASSDPTQWGVLGVSLWFTFSHLRGIKNNFGGRK